MVLGRVPDMPNKATLSPDPDKARPGVGKRSEPGWGVYLGLSKLPGGFRVSGFPAYFLSLQNGAGDASPSGPLREACAGSVRKTIKCQTNRRLTERFLPPRPIGRLGTGRPLESTGAGQVAPACLLGREEEKPEGGTSLGRGGFPADPSRFNRTLKNKKR